MGCLKASETSNGSLRTSASLEGLGAVVDDVGTGSGARAEEDPQLQKLEAPAIMNG